MGILGICKRLSLHTPSPKCPCYSACCCKDLHLHFTATFCYAFYHVLHGRTQQVVSIIPQFELVMHATSAGHSLGGAVATLAAYDIQKSLQRNPTDNVEVICYNFAAPRTGNHAFAQDYNAVVPDTWSVINDQVSSCSVKPYTFKWGLSTECRLSSQSPCFCSLCAQLLAARLIEPHLLFPSFFSCNVSSSQNVMLVV